MASGAAANSLHRHGFDPITRPAQAARSVPTRGWYGQAVKTQIDHLVVVAQTLELGVHWCEATVGITPGPGGEHAQYGTHNRLFKIATPANPLAYLEIIAINPEAKRPASACSTARCPA